MLTVDRLPGRVQTCNRCKAPFVFARTVATERGKGGKPMPIDLVPRPDGNVAVRIDEGRWLYARVLAKDETHDLHTEVLCMPHFATCGTKKHTDELAARRRARTQGETR